MEKITLRNYQLAAVSFGKDFFAGATRGSRCVLAGPTGCGKSMVLLALQRELGDLPYVLTPRLEIARGILQKAGAKIETMADLVRESFARKVVTPIRFRNALSRGEIAHVPQLIVDEGHHASAKSYEEVQLLAGMPPTLLLTATPFRGTARGTHEFLEAWGRPTWMLTLPEAVARGDVSMPRCSVLPLVDDDEVTLNSSGEFDVRSISSAYMSRIEDLAEACTRFVGPDGMWDRPTAFAVPSTDLARELANHLTRRNCLAVTVTASTKRGERDSAYSLLLSRAAALVQVAVLGEGVDLPIRRLVDAYPRMSPVAFMQQLGRCTRPCPEGSEYLCTNRNLGRFSYLFEGLMPPSVVADSDRAFGRVSSRASYRAMGLEAVGKFRPAEVPLLDGCTALFFALTSVGDGRAKEFACVVHPASPDPVWAEKVNGTKPDGSRDWGRWRRCEAPLGITGFASVNPMQPSPKQLAWWQRSAESRGLDPTAKVNRKSFCILPVLFDLGISFRSR